MKKRKKHSPEPDGLAVLHALGIAGIRPGPSCDTGASAVHARAISVTDARPQTSPAAGDALRSPETPAGVAPGPGNGGPA